MRHVWYSLLFIIVVDTSFLNVVTINRTYKMFPPPMHASYLAAKVEKSEQSNHRDSEWRIKRI